MKRHHLPALVTLAALATLSVLELRSAYEEGRACRDRGGVIIEGDFSVESLGDTMRCTADY